MHSQNRFVAAIAAACSLVVLAGCGGGSSSNLATHDFTTPYTDLTRAMEGNYDYSARVLALPDAEAAQKVFLSVERTSLYDADIKRIRTAYPEVVGIVARPSQSPSSLDVTVKPDAPWVREWYLTWANNAPLENLATRDTKVDAVLARYRNEYAMKSVFPVYFEQKNPVRISFFFDRVLNMQQVAKELRGTNPYIIDVQAGGNVGGDTIERKANGADGSRNYTFSAKWDCESECRAAHNWNFTVSPDGNSVTLVSETGNSLSEKTN